MYNPNDIEIRWVAQEGIYDLFVCGRFRNFFKTFPEAALEAEKLMAADPMDTYRRAPKRKGKIK